MLNQRKQLVAFKPHRPWSSQSCGTIPACRLEQCAGAFALRASSMAADPGAVPAAAPPPPQPSGHSQGKITFESAKRVVRLSDGEVRKPRVAMALPMPESSESPLQPARSLRRQGSFLVCPQFRRIAATLHMGRDVPDQYASVAICPLLYWACELLARLTHGAATLIFWVWGWRQGGAGWSLQAVAMTHAAIVVLEIPIFQIVGPVRFCQRTIAWPFLASHMILFSVITLYPLFQVRTRLAHTASARGLLLRRTCMTPMLCTHCDMHGLLHARSLLDHFCGSAFTARVAALNGPVFGDPGIGLGIAVGTKSTNPCSDEANCLHFVSSVLRRCATVAGECAQAVSEPAVVACWKRHCGLHGARMGPDLFVHLLEAGGCVEVFVVCVRQSGLMPMVHSVHVFMCVCSELT